MRGGDAGHQVRGPGPGGGDRDADAAAGPRVAVGHVRGALLVPDQHVPDRVVEHRVVRRQDGAARIAEDGAHAFVNETFPDDLRAGALIRHSLAVCPAGRHQSN